MDRKLLLESPPDYLEGLSDEELEKLFARYFTVTRPEKGVQTKNKVTAALGGGTKGVGKKAPPDLLKSLGTILSSEQMADLQKLAAAQKK
jgi:hypothetical protein